MSLQGLTQHILTSSDKILAFKSKVNLGGNHVAKGNLEIILLFLELNSEEGYHKISSLIESHLGQLDTRIENYFMPP